MSRRQGEANLDRQCLALQSLAESLKLPPPTKRAVQLSEGMYLAHSTSGEKFSAICAAGHMASALQLAEQAGKQLSAGRTEVILGTADSVFFFVAPFRYPNTACGLLFARSLEVDHSFQGAATPFDSGALLTVFIRPDPDESPKEFLARHEMPLTGHRRYLALSMDALFSRPEDYVDGVEQCRPGPLGLTGGDCRRWTHEVRIPGRVPVRGSQHLQAIFASRARVGDDPDIEALFQWCKEAGIDRVAFDTPGGDDFAALRQSCLDYIRRKLQ